MLSDLKNRVNKVFFICGPSGTGKKISLSYLAKQSNKQIVTPLDYNVKKLAEEIKAEYTLSYPEFQYLTPEYFELLAIIIKAYTEPHNANE